MRLLQVVLAFAELFTYPLHVHFHFLSLRVCARMYRERSVRSEWALMSRDPWQKLSTDFHKLVHYPIYSRLLLSFDERSLHLVLDVSSEKQHTVVRGNPFPFTYHAGRVCSWRSEGTRSAPSSTTLFFGCLLFFVVQGIMRCCWKSKPVPVVKGPSIMRPRAAQQGCAQQHRERQRKHEN